MKLGPFVLILTILATGCASGPLPGRTVSTAAAIEGGVGAFEQQLENAAAARDVGFLEHAFAPTLLFTHAGGTQQNRAALLADFRSPPQIDRRTLSRTVDQASRRIEIHGDVAVTRGAILVRRRSDGGENEYTVQYIRVYRRNLGSWQLLSHNTVGEIRPPS